MTLRWLVPVAVAIPLILVVGALLWDRAFTRNLRGLFVGIAVAQVLIGTLGAIFTSHPYRSALEGLGGAALTLVALSIQKKMPAAQSGENSASSP